MYNDEMMGTINYGYEEQIGGSNQKSLPNQNNMNIDEHDKRCAPAIEFDGASCITLSLLIAMAHAYNVDASDSDKIKLDARLDMLHPVQYKKILLTQLNSRMGDKCTTQKCWTQQDFMTRMEAKGREELEKYTFRPDGPKKKTEWLSNIDIEKVISQYEKADKNFKFLGAVPIDFDDLSYLPIKNLNYMNLYNDGKYKIAIVFNLDRHDQSGSHWVSMYTDLKAGQLYFFDSLGKRPVLRIRKLLRRIYNFMTEKLGKKNIQIGYNTSPHQFDDTECGVYSIHFIDNMLAGKSFEEVAGHKINDAEMNKYRNVFFSNTNV